MTDQQICETLRQAVRTGVVVGWKPLADGTWLVNPQTGPCIARTWWEIRDYCSKLKQAGVR